MGETSKTMVTFETYYRGRGRPIPKREKKRKIKTRKKAT